MSRRTAHRQTSGQACASSGGMSHGPFACGRQAPRRAVSVCRPLLACVLLCCCLVLLVVSVSGGWLVGLSLSLYAIFRCAIDCIDIDPGLSSLTGRAARPCSYLYSPATRACAGRLGGFPAGDFRSPQPAGGLLEGHKPGFPFPPLCCSGAAMLHHLRPQHPAM